MLYKATGIIEKLNIKHPIGLLLLFKLQMSNCMANSLLVSKNSSRILGFPSGASCSTLSLPRAESVS